jgi:hypothetical protein
MWFMVTALDSERSEMKKSTDVDEPKEAAAKEPSSFGDVGTIKVGGVVEIFVWGTIEMKTMHRLANKCAKSVVKRSTRWTSLSPVRSVHGFLSAANYLRLRVLFCVRGQTNTCFTRPASAALNATK